MIATYIAAFAALVASLIAAWGIFERRSDREREMMIKGLEHLTGGSQQRSVGIALIEGLWYNGQPYERAIMPALVNQAVYLLLETEHGEHRHQFHTWYRIMELILRVPRKKEFHTLYCELADALTYRLADEPKRTTGIDIPPLSAKLWLEKLSSHAGLGVKVYKDKEGHDTV